MATCRDCDADILWLHYASSGKSIAVNASRVIGGNIEIEDAGAVYVKASRVEVHFIPHAATCPVLRRERDEERKAKDARRRSLARRQLKLF